MKKFILSLGLLFSISSVFSQSFMQGAGFSLFGVAPSDNNGFFFNEALTYTPSINFVETEKLSVSAGIPLSFGFSFGIRDRIDSSYYSRSSYTAPYSGFFINAPMNINLNIGRGSSKSNVEKIGYFVGLGYGIYSASYSVARKYETVTDNESTSTSGLTIDAGMRFGVGSKRAKRPKNIEFRLSHLIGSSVLSKRLYGAGCSFNF